MKKRSSKRAMAIVRGTVAERKRGATIFNDAIATGRSVKILNYTADNYAALRIRLKLAGFTVRTIFTPSQIGLGHTVDRGSNIRLHIDTKG